MNDSPTKSNEAIKVDPEKKDALDNILFGEIQLILAEKRTALSGLRTGIAVFALPLSVLSVLIATSKYYQIVKVLPFLVPLLALNAALIVLGCYLVIHAILRIRHYDRLIKELKRQHSTLAEFMD
jgi:uncharacterized membrane protein YdbT with pleckstrin-like domain